MNSINQNHVMPLDFHIANEAAPGITVASSKKQILKAATDGMKSFPVHSGEIYSAALLTFVRKNCKDKAFIAEFEDMYLQLGVNKEAAYQSQ